MVIYARGVCVHMYFTVGAAVQRSLIQYLWQLYKT